MSGFEWMVSAALALVSCLFIGYLLFKVRAKYIYIEYRLSHTPDGLPDQAYEVEEYGCVSLLATGLGVICCVGALASFVILFYEIVAIVLVPLMRIILPAVPVLYGILFVAAYGFFGIAAILSFFKDLLNPQR